MSDLFREFIRYTSVPCPFCGAGPQQCCIVRRGMAKPFEQLHCHVDRQRSADKLVPRRPTGQTE